MIYNLENSYKVEFQFLIANQINHDSVLGKEHVSTSLCEKTNTIFITTKLPTPFVNKHSIH